MSSQRISAGALVVHRGKLLLVRHHRPGQHDFWVAPGGGVEGNEELSDAAEREAFEETGLTVKALRLAYIDEGWTANHRVVKFWFLADYVSGVLDVTANPATAESITEAGWFAEGALPTGHVFPAPMRERFWVDLRAGFPTPIKLPLRQLLF